MEHIKILLYNGSNYGKLMLLIGILVAVPIATVLFYVQEVKYISAFAIPSSVAILLGLLVCYFSPNREERVLEWQSPLQRGGVPVLFAWCFAFLVGAMPFVLGNQLSFILALFESVSGWTTTGLSVVHPESLPKIFLFHRAFMQYCGGLGFVIVIAMLIQEKQSMNLYNAEGHPDGLLPNLKRTSRAIFYLYVGELVLGIASYRLFGMPFFDAICHTMSALSTAGFSTSSESIAFYRSAKIEIVTIILMLIGSTNFAILLLIVKRKFKQLIQVSEFRFMVGLTVVFSLLITFSLMKSTGDYFSRSLLDATFGVVTAFSTTGYSTADYSMWPPFALGLFMLLMLIGGGVGSTAGGIKLLRTYLLIRITGQNIRKKTSPARRVTFPVYYRVQGKTPIDDSLVKDTIGFISCYMGIFFIGTLLLTLTADASLMDAMYEFGSAFGTVGVSNGLTNAEASAGTLIVQMLGMLLGRLEIFIVFIGIYSFFSSGLKAFSRMKAPT